MTVDPGLAASAPERLVSWIEAETGLRFPEVHHETIRRVARARSAKLGLEADAYEELIRYDAAEKEGFFNEIMIGETYFFRDEKHFAILISDILPGLIGEGRELRLWSATCANAPLKALELRCVLDRCTITTHAHKTKTDERSGRSPVAFFHR